MAGCTTNGATLMVTLPPILLWPRQRISFAGSTLRSTSGSLLSRATVPCCQLSFAFSFLLFLPVLCDLLRSFALASAPRQLRPSAWDLTLVLRFLNTSSFEPLAEVPLCALTQKVLFLVAFATAKRVGELQALSSVVTFVHGDACLSYVPDFVAKSESLSRTIPRSFLVRSLSDFAAGLDEPLALPCTGSPHLFGPSLYSVSSSPSTFRVA